MNLKKLWPWRRRPDLAVINSLDFEVAAPTPRTGIAIGVIVRDEGRYLREWLRFHEYLGVDHFILYDDGSTDATVQIAQTACKRAAVTVFPWSQRLRSKPEKVAINNQIVAYGHCLSNYRNRFRWMAFLDVDEFLLPLSASTIPAVLDTLSTCPLIALPWAMFGTCGHLQRPVLPTTQAYTRRLDPSVPEGVHGLANVKCIFDPQAVTRLHVHRMRVNGTETAHNDRGVAFHLTPRSGPAQLTCDAFQLNHYYSRSQEDVEAKIQRGRVGDTNYGQRDRALLTKRVAFIDTNSIDDHKVKTVIARRNAETGESFYGDLQG